MARLADVKKDSATKKGPLATGRVQDETVADFDAEGDAFAGTPAPPDDGKYLVKLSTPLKGDTLRTIEWTDKQTGDEHTDFSVRFVAECVDPRNRAYGRKWFGDFNTFTRKTAEGKATYQVASILAKAEIRPTGKKFTDAKSLEKLITGGTLQLYAKSTWRAQLKWDEKADEDYKQRTKIVFLQGQKNFENGSGRPTPLQAVPEDTVITKKVRGVEVEYEFKEGEPLRTDAVLSRFQSVEEGGE